MTSEAVTREPPGVRAVAWDAPEIAHSHLKANSHFRAKRSMRLYGDQLVIPIREAFAGREVCGKPKPQLYGNAMLACFYEACLDYRVLEPILSPEPAQNKNIINARKALEILGKCMGNHGSNSHP